MGRKAPDANSPAKGALRQALATRAGRCSWRAKQGWTESGNSELSPVWMGRISGRKAGKHPW
jgi:hypothetical protein